MAEMIARGCPACSMDLVTAEREMRAQAEYFDSKSKEAASANWRVRLDGEEMSGKEVIAVVPGEIGWLLRNHRDETMTTRVRAHLCSCGNRNYIEREIWRGKVELVPADGA